MKQKCRLGQTLRLYIILQLTRYTELKTCTRTQTGAKSFYNE